LNDDSIDACYPCGVNHVDGSGELIGEHDDVGGQIHTDASNVGEPAGLSERLKREVLCAASGVEHLYSQIDGIGTVGNRCPQRIGTACRSEKLRQV